MNQAFQEIDEEHLQALIKRVEEAIEYDLALSPEDNKILLNALLTLMHVQERLASKDVTLHKLRKLLGIVRSSEKLNDVFPQSNKMDTLSDDNEQSQKKTRKPREKPVTEPITPEVVHHNLIALNKGDTCPECDRGTLYQYKPTTLLRISGNSPYQAVEHVCERLRCNTCGAYFAADLPEEVKLDGDSQQKYGYSARTLMAIHKCFAGCPYYRQESMQSILGLPISASTIFDQMELVANDLQPIFKAIKQLGANAPLFYLDDTPNRIIEQKPELRKKRRSNKMVLRKGIYTSGIIAHLPSGHKITLYQTNLGHGGESIDELLRDRASDLPKPVLMSDALSSNTPTVVDTVQALCNSHGRRQYVDVANHFPEEVEWVLNQYKLIWQHDDEAKAQQMTPAERLGYHQAHSLPIMEAIREWGLQHLAMGTIEENSGLGKAIKYFDNHFEGLTQFCRQEGAPIDNNEMERQLKLAIRNRKNALFFKTATGAAIYDVITSMIATAIDAGINIFKYFNAIQQHKYQVKLNPEKWLPWNYEANLMSL